MFWLKLLKFANYQVKTIIVFIVFMKYIYYFRIKIVRTVKFIARKNWILVGSDDLILRVFNYNTLERVTQFTAHSDYIRGLIVHPSRPIVLSCSDDLSIKAWDWEKGWKQVATFEGHSNYVMGIALNPKDSNTFASASLDQTIKVKTREIDILLMIIY